MRPRTRIAGAAAGAAILALALVRPALGQQHPESLLPPGFGAPVATPAPAAPPPPTPRAPITVTPATPAPAPVPTPQPPAQEDAGDAALATDEAGEAAEQGPAEMPDAARRSLEMVGAGPGYGDAVFGDADGRYLATLMRRIDTPIASRWAEITLRRMLLSATPAPPGEAQADWVADRADLLLRLGEADGARLLVQGVDVQAFSPRLRRAAIQTALATADPAALCPLKDGPEQVGDQPAWPMIRAMCAALSGDVATANATIGRGNPYFPIDHALAEKVIAIGGAGRRAVTIDWTVVDKLTDWRFGLASALNVLIPQPLLDQAPVWFQAWLARAPMLAAAQRVAPARIAAALGVLSSADLVDLYGRVSDESGDTDADTPASRLRAAYRGGDGPARLDGLHGLWDGAIKDGPNADRDRYAASILTARAVAGLDPADAAKEDVPLAIASLFSAGLDEQAERWAPRVGSTGGDAGERAWAMLAVGAPRPVVATDAARVRRFVAASGESGRHRAEMLMAALAGLGRIGPGDATAIAREMKLPLFAPSPYARAMDRAVTGNGSGTVALLVATGMQTGSWSAVPATDFYRMIAGLRSAGLTGEARMIAAEAMARL